MSSFDKLSDNASGVVMNRLILGLLPAASNNSSSEAFRARHSALILFRSFSSSYSLSRSSARLYSSV